jgi:hypothetical protein
MNHPPELVCHLIREAITELPAAEREACVELVEHMRRQIEAAGEPVGTLALALLGAEAQLKASQ